MGEKDLRLICEPNLRALHEQFKRCSESYPPLYHDRLWAWSADGRQSLSDAAWDMFTAANPEPADLDDEWWVWDRTLRAPAIGRFWGNPEGLAEFEDLAESAAFVFKKMGIDMEGPPSCASWLSLLHDIAFHESILLLRSDQFFWGIAGEQHDDFDELVEEWHCSPEGDRQYPLHPLQWMLVHNVFTSSMAAIDVALAPDSILSKSFVLDPTFIEKRFARTKAVSEIEVVVSVAVPTSFFRQIDDGVWDIQYVQDGRVIETRKQIRGNEGFVICQQILAASGNYIRNFDLGSKNKRPPVHVIERTTESGEPLLVTLKELGGFSDVDEAAYHDGDFRAPLLSDEALEIIEVRLRVLEDRLKQARIAGDEEKAQPIQEELERTQAFLSASVDLRGASRKFVAGDPEDKARSRVSKAIGECVVRLADKGFAKLALFLDVNLAPAGRGRIYLRQPEVPWET